MAMGHNLCVHFGADEHPCTTYFDVHQGYRALTHSHIFPGWTDRACTIGSCFLKVLLLAKFGCKWAMESAARFPVFL